MKRSLRTAVFLCALILAPALLFSQADWSGKPVKLSIIDVAGNLRLSKPAIEAFKAANPKMISDIEYTIARPPSSWQRSRRSRWPATWTPPWS